jgi:hypothetical protein
MVSYHSRPRLLWDRSVPLWPQGHSAGWEGGCVALIQMRLESRPNVCKHLGRVDDIELSERLGVVLLRSFERTKPIPCRSVCTALRLWLACGTVATHSLPSGLALPALACPKPLRFSVCLRGEPPDSVPTDLVYMHARLDQIKPTIAEAAGEGHASHVLDHNPRLRRPWHSAHP